MVIQEWSKQSFQPHHPGVSETTRPIFFLIFFLQIYWETLNLSVKTMTIHSHRDLNSVSSSTDKTNLLGHIPSRLRSPDPRVCMTPRAATSSSGVNTSLSLKPAGRNSLKLITITTGVRDVSTSGVHSWNVSPETSSSTLLSHHLMTRARSLL
jgi:hypothetical protein